MQFSVSSKLGYRVQAPTPFVFNVQATRFRGQTVSTESLSIQPEIPIESWTMPESGNRYFRLIAPPGGFTISYQATVRIAHPLENPALVREVPPGELPLNVLTYLYPSRYCQSDRLERFARRGFGALPPGYQRVAAVCNWIHDNVDYESGASDALTSAFDTVSQRAGVCRDFAHLGIALTRALGVPARYVSAYAWRLQPADFHAVFEAFLTGPAGPGWYLFDPTRMAAPEGVVRIGIGRDAAEVAFCTQFGVMAFDKPEVSINGPTDAPPATTQAVRTQDA
ncbi:transglutaminase-like domain-containing protein [Rhodopila sp.]|uniref:transglutaminase-like domain-containing protein n=1 Tax=Rhodopila sp. TaxID=2480087 RepID=UPI003D0C07AB